MDFNDYTTILANLKIITWKQASEITDAMHRLGAVRDDAQYELEKRFWDDELRYGSDD